MGAGEIGARITCSNIGQTDEQKHTHESSKQCQAEEQEEWHKGRTGP